LVGPKHKNNTLHHEVKFMQRREGQFLAEHQTSK